MWTDVKGEVGWGVEREGAGEAGIAQWLERQARDRKVAGSSPGRSGGRIFVSRVNFLY